MRKIISLICLLLPIAVYADELRLQENAPESYVVVKGDTLWDISAKFFKDPWKWPEIWGFNKESIKDPHWIYPGDVVYLDHLTHTLRVGEAASAPAEAAALAGIPEAPTVKLSPRVRVLKRSDEAIPVISLKDIGPFLVRPLVIEDEELEGAPVLVGSYEQKKLLGTDDVAYAENMPSDKGGQWQIYRPNHTLVDPDTGEVLGHEVVYLGDANVEKFGSPITTLRITNSVLEISRGDRFAQATSGFASNYQPHAPEKEIAAKVISIYGGVNQAGQNGVVTLNKGRRDGVENGDVLALYQKGEVLHNGLFTPDTVLPDVRYGLVFVFRVFDKVSYALVMETRLPVQLLDRASNPE